MNGLDFIDIAKEVLKSLPLQTKLMFAFIIILKITLDLFGAKIKGHFGEYIVKKRLEKLNQNKYRVLNDVMIRSTDGTTQIDHIVVSIYGIFVIETKHYKGWIHGNEYQNQWTQSIYRKKIKIPNPIHQNYGHVMNLKALLENYPEMPIYPIVVFTGSAVLKNVNTKTDVIYSRDLVRLIEGYSQVQVLDTKDMEEIVRIITSENIVDSKAKRQHVKTIRENMEGKKNRVLQERKEAELLKALNETGIEAQVQETQKCGFCGADLVLRKGKHGEFYGCSGYPKCRFTRSLGKI